MIQPGEKTTLDKLAIGQTAEVLAVGGQGTLRQRFLDMGVIPGAAITLVKFAPMGDPMEFTIHGYELTLGVADASRIDVRILDEEEIANHASRFAARELDFEIAHPGLGEGGRYHDKEHENPLPEDSRITFALVGNQNSGKTTLFNQLTGASQHVGNFPGVTMESEVGQLKTNSDALVVDLPGIYSMSPYGSEEEISRQFILGEKPQGIINIVDATNIERNLYLTMQLMELSVPMVLALNMMDEVQGNGGSIRVNEMETLLGIPVVPISAISNQGVDELIQHAFHVAHFQECPAVQDFCSQDDNGGAVHRCLHAVMHIIWDHAEKSGIPARFAATKLIEGDQLVRDALNLHQNDLEAIEHLVSQMESERGLDRGAAIAEMRYAFIGDVVSKTVVKPKETRQNQLTRKVDNIFTGKWTAIPAFICVMALVFWLTFDVIGLFLQNLIQDGVDALAEITANAMASAAVNDAVQSLVLDGIFNGMGIVISFLPIIVTLFFFLSLLEDTGYMARVAFVMDKLLRKLGLSGRSIVPLLTGFGCTVPAVMATRTLPSERDRKLTILMTPFMSCSTKITVYAFLTAIFFPGHGAIVMICLYLLGIVMGILTALVTRNTALKGDAVPFVMELPHYRMPSAKSIGHLVWEKSYSFLKNAFTVIFLAVIVVWFLQSFGPSLTMVENPSESLLAMVAGVLTPIFQPLGLGDWRIVTSLIAGFTAKETVVSTLSVLFASTALSSVITPSAALALLVFCLLYTPCIAAITMISRELGPRWGMGIIVYQCTIAWVMAFIVHAIALAVGMP